MAGVRDRERDRVGAARRELDLDHVLACGGPRVNRVEQQVHDHLLELRGIAAHRRDRGEPPDESGVVAQVVIDHPERLLDDAGQVHRPRSRVVGSREQAQPLGDRGDTRDPVVDLLQVSSDRGRRALGQVRIREQRLDPLRAELGIGQRVVDLVGHARGQRAERGEPIGFDHAPLDLPSLGDVAGEREHGRLPLPVAADRLDLDDPVRILERAVFVRRHLGAGPEHLRDALGGELRILLAAESSRSAGRARLPASRPRAAGPRAD